MGCLFHQTCVHPPILPIKKMGSALWGLWAEKPIWKVKLSRIIDKNEWTESGGTPTTTDLDVMDPKKITTIIVSVQGCSWLEWGFVKMNNRRFQNRLRTFKWSHSFANEGEMEMNAEVLRLISIKLNIECTTVELTDADCSGVFHIFQVISHTTIVHDLTRKKQTIHAHIRIRTQCFRYGSCVLLPNYLCTYTTNFWYFSKWVV